MTQPVKPTIAWIIGRHASRGRDWIIPAYCSLTRRDAIEQVVKVFVRKTWKDLRKEGFFVTKVRIESIGGR